MKEFVINNLNLDETYYIENINIDDESHIIYVDIAQKGAKLPCPLCSDEAKVYDHLAKQWRHVNVDQYKVYIRFNTPRIKCEQHGVKLCSVTWAEPKQHFTTSLEEFVCDLAENMSFSQIARELGEHDTRIRRIILRRKNEKNNI